MAGGWALPLSRFLGKKKGIVGGDPRGALRGPSPREGERKRGGKGKRWERKEGRKEREKGGNGVGKAGRKREGKEKGREKREK